MRRNMSTSIMSTSEERLVERTCVETDVVVDENRARRPLVRPVDCDAATSTDWPSRTTVVILCDWSAVPSLSTRAVVDEPSA